MKFIVKKSLFKMSERKKYEVGEEIEMLKDDAKDLLAKGWVVAIKPKKKDKKSPVIDELKTK